MSVQNRHESTRPRCILLKVHLSHVHIETLILPSIELNVLNLTNMDSNHGCPNLADVFSLTFPGFPDKINKNSLTFLRGNFGF